MKDTSPPLGPKVHMVSDLIGIFSKSEKIRGQENDTAITNANITYSTHKNLNPNAFSIHNNTQMLGCGPWDQVSYEHNSLVTS